MRVGWDWWTQTLGSPRFVCAPMVDQSELAFRVLCRSLGTDLCYGPMLHARLFNEVPTYRKLHFDAHPADKPFIAQLAGHDPATVLSAARYIEERVDAVDLNFGCPQGIARKGRYGAFLLDEPDVMVALVRTLSSELSVPVTAKLRLLPSRPESIALCKRLEEAGASAVALHGRTREMKKQHCGAADWDAIAEAVDALGIPVIANGGIGSLQDAEACLAHTGAAAVMSSEALLENPALFCANRDPNSPETYLDQDELARRYLAVCKEHPPSKGPSIVRGHLFKLLHNGLYEHTALRDELLLCRDAEQMGAVAERLAEKGWAQPRFHADDSAEHSRLSWYNRHRVGAPGGFLGTTKEDATHGEVMAARVDAQPARSREQLESDALEKRARKQAARRAKRQIKREAGSRRAQKKARDERLAQLPGMSA